jgi:hypothetical protein
MVRDVMNDASIDVDALKGNYRNDSLPYHLWTVALDCKKKRDAFWRWSRRMKFSNNILSIPLLLLSSGAGLTSMAQLGTQANTTLSALVTVFGVTSAALTAFQRYFRYAERAEQGKHMAKNYARIARRIESTLIMVGSKVTKLDAKEFENFMEEVQQELDSLIQETEEVPKELMNDSGLYDKLIESFMPKSNYALHPMLPMEDLQQVVGVSRAPEHRRLPAISDARTMEELLQDRERFEQLVGLLHEVQQRNESDTDMYQADLLQGIHRMRQKINHLATSLQRKDLCVEYTSIE